jgi:hypothetical protein
MKHAGLWAIAVALLTGCDPVEAPVSDGPVNQLSALDLGEIETDANGRCFTRTARPTQTTIIQEQVLVVPEVRDANGTVTSPPVFRNITRPQTVEVGQGDRFETLCPPQYTPTLVATLQRALRVRGVYAGPINSTLDTATSAAISEFQQRSGRDSDVLDIAVARQLGVVTTPLDQLDDR